LLTFPCQLSREHTFVNYCDLEIRWRLWDIRLAVTWPLWLFRFRCLGSKLLSSMLKSVAAWGGGGERQGTGGKFGPEGLLGLAVFGACAKSMTVNKIWRQNYVCCQMRLEVGRGAEGWTGKIL
jgi:hypothetical protein